MSVINRVKHHLSENHAEFDVIRHPLAYTAQEEAAACHISGHEWAKTVVFLTQGGEPVMAVLPASSQVELVALAKLVGDPGLRLAEEGEFAPLYPDCQPGAQPPFGDLYGQRLYVDERLTEDEEIVFNAGDHTEAVRMRYADFARIAEPIVGRFGEAPSTN